eukprot:12267420-Heterocapsa_arctica.AAC.1
MYAYSDCPRKDGYASDELKGDVLVIMGASKRHGHALEYALVRLGHRGRGHLRSGGVGEFASSPCADPGGPSGFPTSTRL